jgi:hypothetical protein
MPRTDVPITRLTPGQWIAQGSGTTADPTNDHVINLGVSTGGKSTPLDELVIRILQTDATARVATIVAGDNPPALSAGMGDLTKSMAQNEVWYIHGLEGGQYMQNDGTILIDLAASSAGTIWAYSTRAF